LSVVFSRYLIIGTFPSLIESLINILLYESTLN